MRLDSELFGDDDEPIAIDVDPNNEDEEFDELGEEFGRENVRMAFYYMHRHRLFKMRILSVSDLDILDLSAFLLIEEEQGLKEAEQQAKLKTQADRQHQ